MIFAVLTICLLFIYPSSEAPPLHPPPPHTHTLEKMVGAGGACDQARSEKSAAVGALVLRREPLLASKVREHEGPSSSTCRGYTEPAVLQAVLRPPFAPKG